MIDPNEIMMGNWVSYDGNPYRVIGIHSVPILDTILYGIGVVEWNDLDPILLDEEWLLKFGFDKEDSLTFKKDWFELWGSSYSGDYQLRIYKVGNDYEKIINIKYVHTLQNLYKSLIGDKLEIQE